jgi:hypothetical protein
MFRNSGYWAEARVLFVLVLFQSLLMGCAERRSTTAAESAATDPLSVLHSYQIAEQRAHAWRSDSYLEYTLMLVPGSTLWTDPETVFFRFWSDHRLGPFSWYEVAEIDVDPHCGCVSRMKTDLYLAEAPHRYGRLDLTGMVLDSTDALLLAEALGGAEYRAKFPNAKIRVRIVRGRYGTPQRFWFVQYFRPPDVYGTELDYHVDATTGEVDGDGTLTPTQAMELLRKAKESQPR